MTIPHAARELEVPERRVERFIADGEIEVVGKSGRSRLVNGDQVREIRDRLRLGITSRRARTVIVVESPELEMQIMSLRAAGLHVELASGVLDSFGLHESTGKPVIVARASLELTEHNLIRTFLQDADFIFVGSPGELIAAEWVDLNVPGVNLAPTDEVKGLVRLCWSLVAARYGDDLLKL